MPFPIGLVNSFSDIVFSVIESLYYKSIVSFFLPRVLIFSFGTNTFSFMSLGIIIIAECIALLGLLYKLQQTGGLNHPNHFSQPWRLEVRGRGVTGLVPPEPPSLACRGRLRSVPAPGPHCAHTSLVSLPLLTGSLVGSARPHRLISLNHPLKGPVPKDSHVLKYWGLELQHTNFERTQFSPKNYFKILV